MKFQFFYAAQRLLLFVIQTNDMYYVMAYVYYVCNPTNVLYIHKKEIKIIII
jgi:hypothetical protein